MKLYRMDIADHTDLIPPDNGIIERVWRLTSFRGKVDHVLLPTNRADVIINSGDFMWYDGMRAPDIHFAGLRKKPVRLRQRGVFDVIGMTFSPWGLSAFAGVSAGELSGRIVSAEDTGAGFGGIRELVQRPFLDDNDRIRVVLREIVGRVDIRRLPETKFIRLIDDTRRNEIPRNVDELCARSGYAKRTIERMFSSYIGGTPKEYLQKERFRRAMRAIETADTDGDGKNFTMIAYDAGYYDQSHMIREFRKFAGTTPSNFRRVRFVKNLFADTGGTCASGNSN